MDGVKENESFLVLNPDGKRIESLNLEVNSRLTKHVKSLNTYSYILTFDQANSIFYSGDTYETNIDIITFLKNGNLAYHDTCFDDTEDNVHTSLRKLCELVPKEYRSQVYCIHIDGDNFVEEANRQGFKIATIN